jgi:hypothetical protein
MGTWVRKFIGLLLVEESFKGPCSLWEALQRLSGRVALV